ncbi:MAG: hypothetical protein CFE24_10005 [Flavobacterium sp. BFFFF2]|nr:MAG: hypothetical protein CFE24_10005 [Flavobacterium sp. BFFFF2]
MQCKKAKIWNKNLHFSLQSKKFKPLHSVALLCSAKKLKSGTKTLIFRFNQKSLNHFNFLSSM